MTLPANHPRRIDLTREGIQELAFRCDSCNRPWVVFVFEGVADRECPFCKEGYGERVR